MSSRSTSSIPTRCTRRLRERGSYLTGPLARYNLASSKLGSLAREAASEAELGDRCVNPFQSIVVRAVEILQACDEAVTIVDSYAQPDQPAVDVPLRAGVGHGATEAPRGLLYHRYEIDEDGTILEARIVPPTSQNQLSIEEDLRGVVQRYIDLPDDELRHCAASRRSATTIPASPAPRISSS